MIRILGYSAGATAFAVALFGMFAAFIGVQRRDAMLVRSARLAAYTNFALMSIANIAMIYALLKHDFSIDYVAQVGSLSTPKFFTVISLWSSLEGSILFWCWILSGYTAASVYSVGSKLGSLGAYANGVMLAVGVFFYLLIVKPASPWHLVSPAPTDGPGPNPLLQNHWLMGVHPPLLYLGYVGMSVPFGYAMGALVSGRLDDLWLRVTRRWTLIAWMFLSLAIIAGMWWSYAVLGWGGYWAWDPVENASFMPWLTATAFLHSSMVQERRSMLRVWNMSLVIATFLLTVLGTFLTRSGILSSVHAFTNGTIGIYFWTFIGTVLVVSLALLSGRSAGLRSRARLESMLSRETTFLFNNLIFTVFTFTVLLGTLFPLIVEAVKGTKVSVGAPFFNSMTVPLCVALLFLMGVGPMLPWRSARMERLKRESIAPFAAFGIAIVIALILHVRSIYGLLAFGFSAFALVGNLGQFWIAAAARRSASGGSIPGSVWGVMNANPRRYGGYIAHIGVIVAALGIAASQEFRTEQETTMRPGESMVIHGYTVRFDSLFVRREEHRDVIGGDFTVLKGARQLSVLQPRLNYYASRPDEAIATPGVRSRFANDLYLVLTRFTAPTSAEGETASLDAIVQPWISWIWAGGIIVALGALFGSIRRRGERSVLDDADNEFVATGRSSNRIPVAAAS